MKKNDAVICPINRVEMIVEHYIHGKLETEIAELLGITIAEVVYILNDKYVIQRETGNYRWKAVVNKRNSNSQKLYYALKQNILHNKYLNYIKNSFLMSHMSVEAYCKEYHISDEFMIFYLNLSNEFYKEENVVMMNEFLSTVSQNQQIEKQVNLKFMGQTLDWKTEFERKKLLLEQIQKLGDIRPYWICGQLAIHNFSFFELCKDTGILELEAELSNEFYMKTLCTDISGNILPYDFNFQILQYVSSINWIESPKKRKKA